MWSYSRLKLFLQLFSTERISKILFVRRIYQVVLFPFKVIFAIGKCECAVKCECAESLECFHSTQTGDAVKH